MSGAGDLRRGHGLVSMIGAIAATFAATGSVAAADACTEGRDCCWIAADGESPPHFAMGRDRDGASGALGLALSGFDRSVIGPLTAAACIARWNAEIAKLPGHAAWPAEPTAACAGAAATTTAPEAGATSTGAGRTSPPATCTPGRNCCWIGSNGGSPERHSMIFDPTLDAVAELSKTGYGVRILGPMAAGDCTTRWNALVTKGLTESSPRATETPKATAPEPKPEPEAVPAPSEPVKLFENWNTAACDLTDRARFRVSTATRVTRVTVWYRFERSEASVPFVLETGGRTIVGGDLRRNDCDPHQPLWCSAIAPIRAELAPGLYTVRLARGRLCRNAGSGDNGFIRVDGLR